MADRLISIGKGESVASIEKYYRSFATTESLVDLKLPQKLAYGGAFAILPALLQFVGTWSRLSNAGSLRFYVPFEDTTGIEKTLQYPLGLVATYMARSLGGRGSPQDRASVLPHAANLVNAMYSGDLANTLKGQGVFLGCFAGARHEFLIPFYQQPRESGLRGTSDFEKLTKDVLAVSDRSFRQFSSDAVVRSIATVIRELIENTNDHASTDSEGRSYDWEYPNVRGLFARKTTLSADGRKDIFSGDSDGSFSYLRTLLDSTGSSAELLELSVFDFGPGIARRRLSRSSEAPNLDSISIREEEELVTASFRLGASSKLEKGTGVGLDSVVRCLGELKAFMRLRTGRLSLRQDFARESSEFAPHHELPNHPRRSLVAGTSFSLLIPLSLRN